MPLSNSCLGPVGSSMILRETHRVAMLGIGGVGMYAVACLLLDRGYLVGGQDLVENRYTESLRSRGALIQIGPILPKPLAETADCLIYSSAITENDPNLRLAREREIPQLSRADALAGLMEGGGPQLAVSGTHGKSTTTAMLAHIYREAGREPTMLCGADTVKESSPIWMGKEGYVYEACEYMHSFWSFRPTVGLITGVEHDHVDCYPTRESYLGAFARFAGEAERVVVCSTDREATAICRSVKTGDRLATYSLTDPTCDLRAETVEKDGEGYRFSALWRGRSLGSFSLPLPGLFNVENALGAMLCALLDGISPDAIRRSLSEERGVRRRLERVGACRGVAVYEDYAHHPTEIKASLTALRSQTKGKLFCVFQSHTYSRTAAYLSEMGEALRLADRIWVLPIYPARETDTLGMSHVTVAHAVGEAYASAEDCPDRIWEEALANAEAGDLLVLMGAGSIHSLFAPFIAKLDR